MQDLSTWSINTGMEHLNSIYMSHFEEGFLTQYLSTCPAINITAEPITPRWHPLVFSPSSFIPITSFFTSVFPATRESQSSANIPELWQWPFTCTYTYHQRAKRVRRGKNSWFRFHSYLALSVLSILTRNVTGTKTLLSKWRSHLEIRNIFKATSWYGINFQKKDSW